ncbi:hypothetical protein QA644_11705 [Rhizobium sp. CC1099]|uniref:hypothetical protein n=1 Tax=Rhizobium sp. CC1099 TaxID=3039160 RepID=UPI0024B1AC9D|nr:hypothetical protein [Rhizobium sp. CC1099]WFU85842.1 hypothetical protein QA644_11705 [Rhizobium sp. CC1099]
MEVLWEDSERVFCRGQRLCADGQWNAVLAVLPAAEHLKPSSLDRLAHEYQLKDELDGACIVSICQAESGSGSPPSRLQNQSAAVPRWQA